MARRRLPMTGDRALLTQAHRGLKRAISCLAPYPEHRETALDLGAVYKRVDARMKELAERDLDFGDRDDDDDEEVGPN